MDIWVFGAAAAAAARCIANQWKPNSKSGTDFSTEVSSCEKSEIPSCRISRLLCRSKLPKDSVASQSVGLDDRSDAYSIDGYSETGAASASGYVENQDQNAPLAGASDLTADMINYTVKQCSGGMDFNNGARGNKSSMRTRYPRSRLIRPINSLESCLIAQLWNEHTEMEEYVFRALPSPSTAVRPLVVTNGSQVISRSSLDYASNRSGVNREETVYGVPPLPKFGCSNLAKDGKSRRRKEYRQKLIRSDKKSSSKSHPQLGSIDEKVLFFLGISLGVMSSFVTNKRDVDKLKESLKQTKSLVQDLQDELEMKEALTVKELANENYESLVTNDNPSDRFASNTEDAHKSLENESQESNMEKAKSPEYMSNIEAELEAELERLGLNVSASSLERRLSDLVETLTLAKTYAQLDPDFVADFAQGELQVDKVREDGSVSGPDRDASGTSTAHSGNTAVSARELSVRLHEVIQSRLEARIRELETALESSQRKVLLMESGHGVVRRLSSRELRYSSGEQSPVSQCDFSSAAQPVVMNLSGDALDAYNEAYEELSKANESGEDDSPTAFYEKMCEQNKEESRTEARPTSELIDLERFQELQYSDVGSEEDSDSNEEMEELIKRILERTKKGSPAVINAQRMLCSIDDDII
ncbi:hypothetical protein LINGRAHAP2_LOCUS11574 [Linum grandiflorum]